MKKIIQNKKDFLKWLAPRVSSLFQEKQKIDVKSDSVVRISWESEPDLIDADVQNISDNKDPLPINNS